ncbi:unnamed protein product, partial [Chrysoparadoxa australica]
CRRRSRKKKKERLSAGICSFAAPSSVKSQLQKKEIFLTPFTTQGCGANFQVQSSQEKCLVQRHTRHETDGSNSVVLPDLHRSSALFYLSYGASPISVPRTKRLKTDQAQLRGRPRSVSRTVTRLQPQICNRHLVCCPGLICGQ